MFELDEQTQMVATMVRQWCQTQLAPKIPVLETGSEQPFEVAVLEIVGPRVVALGSVEGEGAHPFFVVDLQSHGCSLCPTATAFCSR